MEQPKATVLSKATLFSWGFVAMLLLAVFWATTVYNDGRHTQDEVTAQKLKIENLENMVMQLTNELIEVRTEMKFYKQQ